MKQITQFFLEDESLTLIVNIEPWKKCIERETNFKNNHDAAIIFFNYRVVKKKYDWVSLQVLYPTIYSYKSGLSHVLTIELYVAIDICHTIRLV